MTPAPATPARAAHTPVASLADGRLRCALASAARGDGLIGTAPPATTFLAIEVPGPWSANALRSSRAASAATVDLARRVSAAGGRAVAIRHPHRRGGDARAWFWADCRPGHETLRTGTVGDDEELRGLRLDGTDGEPDEEPLWLCCTHGTHDRCCAADGRVVFRDLDALRPGRVWESSHLGGCRFAGNVAVLPHGIYYGRVSTADVPSLVSATEHGEILAPRLRGRTAVPPAAQTALALVARLRGLSGVNAVTVGAPVAASDRRWQVPVDVAGDHVTATVSLDGDGDPVPLTCSAERPDRPPRWSLVDPTS